ncbi:MAG TPA: SRPBCC family protein, partial [Reyranella sp.]|nr:SRPBCC family protein [Reyranella sp.]
MPATISPACAPPARPSQREPGRLSVTRHSERRVVAYTPLQLFELVADVPRYPEFLPWCHAGRIRRREGPNVHIAEL